jgi:hypothetical protein
MKFPSTPAFGREIVAKAILLCLALCVPLYFVRSSDIAAGLGKLLRVEVDPSLTGGRMLAELFDPMGDDAGSGSLEYPLGMGFERGELDLTRYAVRVPLARPAWEGRGAYWQLELSFAKAVSTGVEGGGFRAPVAHIYIDIDGKASGSVESAFGEGELLRFDPSHPWDYAISADGWSSEGLVASADGSYRAPVMALWDRSRRRLVLRISLEKAPRLLASVLGGEPTWHYVLVGAYDGAREGHFAAVREFANLHDGGGADGELCPRVFDMIAPAGIAQETELSSQDAASGVYALIHPAQAGGHGGSAADSSALRARLVGEAAALASKAESEMKRSRAALPSSAEGDASRIGLLFSLGLEDRCLAAAEARLAERKDDSLALAYRGAIVARKAGRAAAVGEKMRLVAEGYRDLDAAIAMLDNSRPTALASDEAAPDEPRLAVLLCRANVSSSVPNDVFGRAAQGAADFEAASAVAAAAGDASLSRRCLADAAIALEKAGLHEEAGSRWSTLAALVGLEPSIELELLDRGYPIPE